MSVQLLTSGYLDRLKAQWWDGRGECSAGRSGGGARISRMYGAVYISAAQSLSTRTLRRIQPLSACYVVATLPLVVLLSLTSLRH